MLSLPKHLADMSAVAQRAKEEGVFPSARLCSLRC